MNMYTVEEVAEKRRVTTQTVQSWIKAGRFPHAKKNGKWLIPECCEVGHSQDEEPETVTPEAVEPEKQVSSAELDRLTLKKDELKITMEIKTLEGEVSGILTGKDKEMVIEREEKVAKAEESLVDREEAVVELESGREALEDARTELESGREALEDEKKVWLASATTLKAEMDKEREEVKNDRLGMEACFRETRVANAAADRMEKKKWDLIRFLWGNRKTLERTVKGSSAPINAKEAIALIQDKLKYYDAEYGAYSVNEKGELLEGGKSVKSWRQEEGFFDDKNTSTIKISW